MGGIIGKVQRKEKQKMYRVDGVETGNREKLSNSQVCCQAQLCLAVCLVFFCFLCNIHSV